MKMPQDRGGGHDAASRLRYFGTSIEEAKRTFDGAAALFDSARADLPKAKVAISSQLEKFNVIVSKLSDQLDKATNQLPDTSKQAADAVNGSRHLHLLGGGTSTLDSMLRSTLVVLIGSFATVLLMQNLANAGAWLRRLIFVGACTGTGVLAAAGMDTYGRVVFAVGTATVATVVATQFFALLMALLDRWGPVTAAALIGLCLVHYGQVAERDIVRRFIPSDYLTTILGEATAGSHFALATTVALTALSGFAWWILRRIWIGRSSDSVQV